MWSFYLISGNVAYYGDGKMNMCDINDIVHFYSERENYQL